MKDGSWWSQQQAVGRQEEVDNEKLTVSRKLKDWKTELGFGEINFSGNSMKSELMVRTLWISGMMELDGIFF